MKAGMRMLAVNNARRNRERMEMAGGQMRNEMRGGQMGMEYSRMGGEEMRRGRSGRMEMAGGGRMEGGSMEYGQNYGGMENRMGGERYAESGGRAEMRGGMPESRFRDARGRDRYNDGRFAPEGNGNRGGNRGAESRYPFWPPIYDREESGMEGAQMNRIGFDMTGDDRRDHIFGEEFEKKQKQSEMAYMGGDEMKNRHGMKERGHAESMEGSEALDEKTAKEWVSKMKNQDGTRGAHWSMDQAKSMMQQRGIDMEPVEFWAILNAMYSDYYSVAKKHHLNGSDFFVDLAKAWLEDEDAVEGKASLYYECIVKHE